MLTPDVPRHPLDPPTPEEQRSALRILSEDSRTAVWRVLSLSTETSWQDVVLFCGQILPPRRVRALLYHPSTGQLLRATVHLCQNKVNPDTLATITLADEMAFHPHSILWPVPHRELWSRAPAPEAGNCATLQAFIVGWDMDLVVSSAVALERVSSETPLSSRRLPTPSPPFQCALPAHPHGPDTPYRDGNVIAWRRWRLHLAMHDSGLVITDISAPGTLGTRQFAHAGILHGPDTTFPALLAGDRAQLQHHRAAALAAEHPSFMPARAAGGSGGTVPEVEVYLSDEFEHHGQAGARLVVTTTYVLGTPNPVSVKMGWAFDAAGQVIGDIAVSALFGSPSRSRPYLPELNSR